MQRFKPILSQFKDKRALVVGDVMLDETVYGEVERISPEAPVGIVKVTSQKYFPGGAANVASNIASLGGSVTLFGFIGRDYASQTLLDLLNKAGINFFPSYCSQTTRKVRVSPRNHQLIRLDYEDTSPKTLDTTLLQEQASGSDMIVVSDYVKGAMSRDLIARLKSFGKPIIVDTKPKNIDFYEGVSLMKLNEPEAKEATGKKDVYEASASLKNRLGCNVIITRGSKGMLLFNGSFHELSATAREVYDVVGAGDTVLAALALSLASGASLEDSAVLANYAAGIKVEKHGTATVSLSELEKRIFIGERENKIKTKEELREIIRSYQSQGKKVIWTNGCFDLLHPGHVRYLNKARELGDILVVGLNSDKSIRSLDKGPDRPIMPQESRAEVLAGLGSVDYITVWDDKRFTLLLDFLRPDVFVKAGDYTLKSMDQDERKVIEAYGGKITFIPTEVAISTSEIVRKIRGQAQ